MENLQIKGSSLESRREFLRELYGIHYDHPVVQKRSEESLLREWATHKLLYQLGLWRSHTFDVDLNYPQNFAEKVGYFLLGVPALWLYR